VNETVGEMSPRKLRENLEAVRAQPFTISLTDGRPLNVPHSEFLRLANDGEQLVLLEGGNALKIVDAEHITSIEFEIPKRSKN